MVLRIESLAAYSEYLQQNPAELSELYKDLLISVTSFFRDPESFEALIHHLKIGLQQQPQRKELLRLWIPGCATGEEVYSLAIRVLEFLHEHQISLSLQLFGTDISDPALDRARQGLYGAAIKDNVSEYRLRRFFNKVDGGYQINKQVRELCVFARHDVTKDPPFSRLDVVSCRNVLIYLDASAQRKVLPTFHYSLNATGLLMLGSAETTGAAGDLFNVLDNGRHIYGRKSVPTRLMLEFGSVISPHDPASSNPRGLRARGNDWQTKLDRIIQARYSPDGVVVNSDLQIIQFKGHTAPYLDPSPGEATLNLLRMARETLVMPLRRAVQRAAELDSLVRDEGAAIEVNGQQEPVVIEVSPILTGEATERYFLVVFTRASQNLADTPQVRPVFTSLEEEGLVLQRELVEAREYLRTVREEYEAHAEELRAANEEARSANEELQSTNEELGTTKEELQSANEELTTVNEELQTRNRELATINSDLRNFLSAVTVAVVMVDHNLRVRRFNSSAEKLLDLGPIDIGRPIGHLRGRIETPKLEEKVHHVIETLNATSDEVQDVNGCWYAIGIRPYRTLDERIAGAVITFQDIDPLKRGLEAAEEAREYAESLIETVREPLIVLDADLRVQRATAAFYETFLVSRDETEGRQLYDFGNGQWNKPRLRELLGCALFKNEPFHDFEVEHEFPHIGRRTMRLSARRIPRRDPRQRVALLAITDVTERREIAEIRFQRLFETAKDGIVVIDVESQTVQDVNPFFLSLTAYSREDFVGKPVQEAGRRVGIPQLGSIVDDTRGNEVCRYEEVITTRDQQHVSVEVVGNRYNVGSQPVIQLNIRDISARKASEEALKSNEERFRLVVESVRDYAIFQLDGSGRIVSWNKGAERVLGWQEPEVIGRSSSVIFTPEDIERGEPEHELDTARLHGRPLDERWHVRKDGSRFFASGVLTRSPESDGNVFAFTKVMQDITHRKQQDDQLRQSLEEKSMLVREIHHRVKNNLQMIVSLLSLQSSHTANSQLSAAFEETEARVRAIAHIHEQLYANDDLSTVEVGGYIASLARELLSIHSRVPQGVRLEVLTDPLMMHIEKAVPLGLIANELILNSLKHAVPAGKGDVKVTLRVNGSSNDGGSSDVGWAHLHVEDSGPGLPAAFDVSQAESMGYQLVNLLVEQLRARLHVRPGPGARITVEFPIPKT